LTPDSLRRGQAGVARFTSCDLAARSHLICRKSNPVQAAKVAVHDRRTNIAPDVDGPRGLRSCRPGDMTMSLILRILFVIAGAITALFVARDALNFTIIQTFVAILLVTAVLLAGSLWSLRRKT
jgi:hypothetical protein